MNHIKERPKSRKPMRLCLYITVNDMGQRSMNREHQPMSSATSQRKQDPLADHFCGVLLPACGKPKTFVNNESRITSCRNLTHSYDYSTVYNPFLSVNHTSTLLIHLVLPPRQSHHPNHFQPHQRVPPSTTPSTTYSYDLQRPRAQA